VNSENLLTAGMMELQAAWAEVFKRMVREEGMVKKYLSDLF